MDEDKFKTSNPSAFAKKGAFTSIVSEEVKNRYLIPVENGYKHNSIHNTSGSNSNIPYNVDVRKKELPKSYITPADKKIVQTCLENRAKISQGIKLLKELIHDNSSKLSIALCCFLARKIRAYNRDNTEILKKITADKENKDRNNELRKLLTMLNEERGKV